MHLKALTPIPIFIVAMSFTKKGIDPSRRWSGGDKTRSEAGVMLPPSSSQSSRLSPRSNGSNIVSTSEALPFHPCLHPRFCVRPREASAVFDDRDQLGFALDRGKVEIGEKWPFFLRLGHLTLFSRHRVAAFTAAKSDHCASPYRSRPPVRRHPPLPIPPCPEACAYWRSLRSAAATRRVSANWPHCVEACGGRFRYP